MKRNINTLLSNYLSLTGGYVKGTIKSSSLHFDSNGTGMSGRGIYYVPNNSELQIPVLWCYGSEDSLDGVRVGSREFDAVLRIELEPKIIAINDFLEVNKTAIAKGGIGTSKNNLLTEDDIAKLKNLIAQSET